MSLNLDKSSWKRVTFGDVVRNVNVTVRNPESAGIDQLIAMEHLDPRKLKIERWGSVADGTTFTRRVKAGQTLFGKRRAYQRKVAYAEFDAICSGDILTLEADETQLLSEFLPFLVQSNEFFDYALGTSAGSLSPRTNWRDLSNFELGLPPLDQQKHIADLLWAVEVATGAKVEVLKRIAALTTVLFESISEGVPVIQLDSWITRIDAGRSPRAANEPAGEDQLGVLKVSAVGREAFVPTENKRLLDPADFRANDVVHSGDLLVTRANAVVDNVVRPCVVTMDYPNLMLSDKTLRLIPRNGYPNRIVLAALRSPSYRAYVREVVNGTEAKNISQAKILAGPVPDLDTDALSHLAVRLVALDDTLQTVKKELERLSMLKASLLVEIFGGN